MSPAPAALPPASVFNRWRSSLAALLLWFEDLKARTPGFHKKLFAAFMGLNMACFWWALLTAYPEKMLTHEAREIVLMSFPVSIFGGLFDYLSLFVTLLIARRALATPDNRAFLSYLSIDLLIAIAATAWVLFVFTVSGWLINLALSLPETLGQRQELYKGRFWMALMNPLHPESLRNIYFGIVMGASAMLPTLVHLYHALRAALGALFAPAPRKV
jgi:hypothetical protein